ncbi:MAG: hypothetical protein ACFCBW_08125, partial [Candidatus Competibacterales bacterium]
MSTPGVDLGYILMVGFWFACARLSERAHGPNTTPSGMWLRSPVPEPSPDVHHPHRPRSRPMTPEALPP